MTAWIGTVIALCALALSAVTAYVQHRTRKRETLAADVTAYFHRTSDFAKIKLPDGTIRQAGYHLVIWNHGPASAERVHLAVKDVEGDTVELADCPPDEFPLDRLDQGARYPVPWLPLADAHRGARRFTVHLRWQDGNGTQERLLPMRRGQTNV
ncbi:hypothetical protein [Streptomyces sp. enrichment culture]|uniref:hypothetical protein n=1 Tax=Streptomyces sp. enrichment culture TaxID=1795815 RepID=UPI003F569831